MKKGGAAKAQYFAKSCRNVGQNVPYFGLYNVLKLPFTLIYTMFHSSFFISDMIMGMSHMLAIFNFYFLAYKAIFFSI